MGDLTFLRSTRTPSAVRSSPEGHLGAALEMVVAALAHNVEEEHRALRGVDPVVECLGQDLKTGPDRRGARPIRAAVLRGLPLIGRCDEAVRIHLSLHCEGFGGPLGRCASALWADERNRAPDGVAAAGATWREVE